MIDTMIKVKTFFDDIKARDENSSIALSAINIMVSAMLFIR